MKKVYIFLAVICFSLSYIWIGSNVSQQTFSVQSNTGNASDEMFLNVLSNIFGDSSTKNIKEKKKQEKKKQVKKEEVKKEEVKKEEVKREEVKKKEVKKEEVNKEEEKKEEVKKEEVKKEEVKNDEIIKLPEVIQHKKFLLEASEYGDLMKEVLDRLYTKIEMYDRKRAILSLETVIKKLILRDERKIMKKYGFSVSQMKKDIAILIQKLYASE